MRISLVVLVATGCGRIAFDERSDAPPPPDAAEHDEDRDGFGDSADNCPHVANDQSNTDADGIGDECDLSPTTAEQVVYFEPFVDPTSWQFGGFAQAGFDGESVIADTRGASDIRALRDFSFVDNDRIIVGAHLGQRDPVNRRQFYIAVHETQTAFYYCELFENGGVVKYGLVHTPDNFIFTTVDSGVPLSPLENGDLIVAITTPSTAATCRTSWPVDRLLLAGPTPAIAMNKIGIYAQNLEVELRWVAVIRTN